MKKTKKVVKKKVVKKKIKMNFFKRPKKLPKFSLGKRKNLIVLPDKAKKVTYDLIPPFAYAEIKTDKETIYNLTEPVLSTKEREIYNKIISGLLEIIDVELTAIKNTENTIEYLEAQIEKVINEIGIKINKKLYQKMMYYVYRDFVGLNAIEPLLHDPYIEDISCDGTNIPLYVIHRKYGSLKTNIVFTDESELKEFIVKMAERSGRFISYAEPLLDGSLPDGSRIQASFSKDVTTHGPTFTIRKFREIPFSPLDLMSNKTVSSEVLAYLWLAVESGSSILIAGGTGTGKTSLLNVLSMFIPKNAKIISVEDSVLGDSEILYEKNGKICKSTVAELIDPFIEKSNANKIENKESIKLFSMDNCGKVKLLKPSFLLRHNVEKRILDIQLTSGKKISVTKDHSLFSLDGEGHISPISGDNIKVGTFIATPRKLFYDGQKIVFDLSNKLDEFKGCFIKGKDVPKFIEENYNELIKHSSKSMLRHYKNNKIIKTEIASKFNISFKDFIIKTKYNSFLPSEVEIDEDIATLIGLWLADGCYDKRSVIFSVPDSESRKVIKRIAKRFNLGYRLHSDRVSIMLDSKPFKIFFSEILGLNGNAYTKRIPNWMFNLGEKETSALLKGYFSGDGTVKKNEVCVSSSSLGLLKDTQTLLLRFGILFRFPAKMAPDKTREGKISGAKFLKAYNNEIGFIPNYKNEKLNAILLNRKNHDISDIVPLPKHYYKLLKKDLRSEVGISRTYKGWKSWDRNYLKSNIGRENLQRIVQKNCDGGTILFDLAFNDVFWDRVASINERGYKGNVYDFSIPETENFICENIIAHNTRELQLPHENWIPSVTRVGFTKEYGEVTMFDLLKESFRQSPDYVIVGEVRGQEAYVMFQGMAAGMPSIGTMHAGKVEDVIHRLETPPISLSPSLIEVLDIVVLMIHTREKGESARRVKEIVEIESVDPNGVARTNRVYSWLPATDDFEKRGYSWLLQKISQKKGISLEDLQKDVEERKKFLESLTKKKIENYREVSDMLEQYKKSHKI